MSKRRTSVQATAHAAMMLGVTVARHGVSDDGAYHCMFDELLEKRLMELDPDFMKEMKKMYESSGFVRCSS